MRKPTETRQNLLKLAHASLHYTFEVMARSCMILRALICTLRCKQQLLKHVAARSIIMMPDSLPTGKSRNMN